MTRSPRNSPRRAAARASEAWNEGNERTSVGRSILRQVLLSPLMRLSPQSRIESEARRGRFAPAFERRVRAQAPTRAAGGAPATVTEISMPPPVVRAAVAARRIFLFTF